MLAIPQACLSASDRRGLELALFVGGQQQAWDPGGLAVDDVHEGEKGLDAE
jgi:hypothetical protein